MRFPHWSCLSHSKPHSVHQWPISHPGEGSLYTFWILYFTFQLRSSFSSSCSVWSKSWISTTSITTIFMNTFVFFSGETKYYKEVEIFEKVSLKLILSYKKMEPQVHHKTEEDTRSTLLEVFVSHSKSKYNKILVLLIILQNLFYTTNIIGRNWKDEIQNTKNKYVQHFIKLVWTHTLEN